MCPKVDEAKSKFLGFKLRASIVVIGFVLSLYVAHGENAELGDTIKLDRESTGRINRKGAACYNRVD
ncbi:hypothetical protein FEM48_Zijuj05G0090000 [Ziziphus jujuba var. spinosa]|uniref:Uncharacterized protein n=1 Tax=Ziziphus jujuba var. spinosa TaxID=714518 RepID=A0A978VE19_ZIZJJ|nr:hypothetical protein FEM48_Zijuj05G0090000 [Ziziphus jujuba var. spinosa]